MSSDQRSEHKRVLDPLVRAQRLDIGARPTAEPGQKSGSFVQGPYLSGPETQTD